MFKRVKESMIIEKAYLLCRSDLGVDAKAMVSRMDFPERANTREQLRQMIRHKGLEIEDVAVLLIVPFFPWISGDAFYQMFSKVSEWGMCKTIQPEVYKHFREELKNCPEYKVMQEAEI